MVFVEFYLRSQILINLTYPAIPSGIEVITFEDWRVSCILHNDPKQVASLPFIISADKITSSHPLFHFFFHCCCGRDFVFAPGIRVLANKENSGLVYFSSKPKSAPSKNAERDRNTSLLCDARLMCITWGQDRDRKSIMSQRGWLTHTRTCNYLWQCDDVVAKLLQ